jgi:putative protease
MTVYNKGFWEGFYLGRKTTEWSDVYGSAATRRKLYIGKGLNYYTKVGVAEFLLENESLNTGDEVLITGPTTGVIQTVVREIRTDIGPVNRVIKGQNFTIPIGQVVRPSDKLYKIVDSSQ